MNWKGTIGLLAFAVLSSACCSHVGAADAPEQPKPTEQKSGGTSVTFGKDSKFTIVVPPEWKQETPSSNMRLLQLHVPKKDTDVDDAELAVFRFPNGGGVDANISRWAGQMGGESSLKTKRNLKTASGQEATVAELEGTYQAMTENAQPKSDYKMIGAIIITDSGEFYLKLIGPYSLIEANKKAFDKAIESFKPATE